MSAILFSAFVCLLSSGLHAAPAGEWNLVTWAMNDGNTFVTGDAADDKLMIAFGVENNGQGSKNPVLKRSTDGGKSWNGITVDLYGGMMFMFTDFQMFDRNTGYAVGLTLGMMGATAGPIWRVKNEGTVLEPLVVDGWPTCTHIHCIDVQHCWATCTDRRIIRTTNAGDTWTFHDLPLASDEGNPGPVFFIDENTGWCAYGKSETTEEEPEYRAGGEYIVHDEGAVLKTTDGGEHWTVLHEGEHIVYNDIHFVNENVGFICASDETHGYLKRTTNGGRDWVDLPLRQSLPSDYGDLPLFYIGGVHFFDENKGWATGSYGTKDSGAFAGLRFFYTENQGQNWSEHESMAVDEQNNPIAHGGTMNDLFFLDEHKGYGLGAMLMVVGYDDGSYVPPEDGDDDPDGDGGPDGDGTDGDVDTGPVYHGEPAEPCPVPEDAATASYPRCDPAKGAPVCAWRDGETPFCTLFCDDDRDACTGLGFPDACCRRVNFEGEERMMCLFEDTACADYSGDWKGYEGPMLGDACSAAEPCDKNYGGVCYDEGAGRPFCTQACQSDPDCLGGFQDEFCCTGEGGPLSRYCLFGGRCDTSDGDDVSPADGDGTTLPDGDDPSGAGASGGSGGGCASTGAAGAGLWLLLAMLLFRRRPRRS